MKRLNAAGSCTEICIDVLWLSGGWIYCTMLLPACGDEGYEVALGAALDLFCLLVRETLATCSPVSEAFRCGQVSPRCWRGPSLTGTQEGEQV